MRLFPLRLLLPALLAASLSAVGACSRPQPTIFPQAPIVLISIDTLRSDRLPDYGYRGVATPAISRLRRDGILFERAYAHVPLTLPSHLSMFTGLLPPEHGVRDNMGYRFDAGRHGYLPSLLKEAGYRTGGAVSAYVLRGETGFAEGFEFYEAEIPMRSVEVFGDNQRPGAETLARAADWLRGVADRPFFFFFHLYEPHSPYEPPEPFASRYPDPYDGEVATADAAVGELLELLRALGVYDRALVMLLSDHGEGLGDHGAMGHGLLLYREALQVPLIVKLPRGARADSTVNLPVQLVDVAPTLLESVGLERPAGMGGDNLLRLDESRALARDIYAETYYTRIHFGWSELTSLIRDRFHYIHGPDPELYDLVADPRELENLRSRERRTAAQLRQALAPLERTLTRPVEEDPETLGRLAALGYLGTAVETGDGPLPDPKSRIHSLKDLELSIQMTTQRKFAEALPVLARLTSENPLMLDAWLNYGTTLQRLGLLDEAVSALEHAMRISGGSGQIALTLSAVFLEMERFDDAREHAELALEAFRSNAHGQLARIAFARKDLETAERHVAEALAADPGASPPRLLLAQIHRERGEVERALTIVDELLARVEERGEQRTTNLHGLRGDLLARLERHDEAIASFRREVSDFPANWNAYSRLAILYTSLGRAPEAVATLRELVERNPTAPAAYAEAIRTLQVLGDTQSAAGLYRHARQQLGDARALDRLLATGGG
jgi:arylsulfatase A-like enzyme/Flp pilus assembly protein TadD